MQATSSTSFGVQQLPGDTPLDKRQLRELLDDSNMSGYVHSLANKITAYSKGITNSPAYWWARRYEVAAWLRDSLFYDNELPIAFHTGSMAEYHHPGLYRVLHQALELYGRHEEAQVVLHLKDRRGSPPDRASTTVHQILLQFPTLQNQFFTLRTRAWFKIVLQEGIGITDYWYRFEFAKSRGTIHFHSLLRCAGITPFPF